MEQVVVRALRHTNNTMQVYSSGLALCTCAVGICASYLYYGMLEEQLFSHDAQVGASFLLLTQCMTNTIMALLWQRLDAITKIHTSRMKDTSPRRLSHPLLLLSTSHCLNMPVFLRASLH